MKTDQLTGPLLDRWVALTLGWEEKIIGNLPMWVRPGGKQHTVEYWNPSQSWTQGGPIIQEEYGHIERQLTEWFGHRWAGHDAIVAEDFLLWMMRAFVASAHGDEVPDE